MKTLSHVLKKPKMASTIVSNIPGSFDIYVSKNLNLEFPTSVESGAH